MLGLIGNAFKNLFTSKPAETEPESEAVIGEVGTLDGDQNKFTILVPNAAVDPNILFAKATEGDNKFTSGVLADPTQTSAQVQDAALVAGAGAGAFAVSDSSPAPALAQNQPPVSDPASRAQTPVSAQASVLDQAPDLEPELVLVQPTEALALAPDPVSIIEPIRILVDSIFTKDDADPLKNYFFSIFMPLADSEDTTKKSIASTPSPAPTITPEQEKDLRSTLEICAGAYISGNTNLTPPDSSDPQSGSTKTTSKSSQISKEKAQPPVYFGVGIKTELAEDGDEKFLKITEIFNNSNLRKEKQDNEDYTNQFITHLNCKLGNDTVAQEYSITDIFKSFENTPNQKEKFDEKIDQIFRYLKETSIKFKISKNTSQTDPAGKPAETAEVNVNKIIFEKTNGVYQQKKMTPSTIIHSTAAIGKGAGAGAGAGAKGEVEGMVA